MESVSTDPGITGAKRQSWQTYNPRDVLLRLIRENPSGDRDYIQAAFWEFLSTKQGQKYAFAVFVGWFANAWAAAHPRHADPVMQLTRHQKVEELKETIKVAAVKMVLLDLTLPNGKALRDCTGSDCAKAGGWLSAVAKRVPKGKTVGDVFSEAEIKKVFSSAK